MSYLLGVTLLILVVAGIMIPVWVGALSKTEKVRKICMIILCATTVVTYLVMGTAKLVGII